MGSTQQSRRDWLARSLALVTALVVGVGVPSASAQSAAASTIHGVVKDDTGGALPGVTVTLTSPALQVGQRVETTGADGGYRFEQLPGGTYQLKFELTGFGTFVRNDLQIAIGHLLIIAGDVQGAGGITRGHYAAVGNKV